MPFCTNLAMNASNGIRRDRPWRRWSCDGAMGLEEAQIAAQPARSTEPPSASLPEQTIRDDVSMILLQICAIDGIEGSRLAAIPALTREPKGETALAVAAQTGS